MNSWIRNSAAMCGKPTKVLLDFAHRVSFGYQFVVILLPVIASQTKLLPAMTGSIGALFAYCVVCALSAIRLQEQDSLTVLKDLAKPRRRYDLASGKSFNLNF